MTDLANKMRELSASGHERAIELTDKADELDEVTKGFYSEPQTKTVQQFMGAWARARKLWCDCAGEPLV